MKKPTFSITLLASTMLMPIAAFCETLSSPITNEVTLSSDIYTTDNLTVLGTLNPNGKTINAENTDTVNITVGRETTTSSEISSDLNSNSNVSITNYGKIKGVITDGDLNILNYGTLYSPTYNYPDVQDEQIYSAANIYIENHNTIDLWASLETTATDGEINIENYGEISSEIYLDSGTLNNYTGGELTNLELVLNSNQDMTINNYGKANLDNYVRANSGSTINYNNYGTIQSSETWKDDDLGYAFSIGTFGTNTDTYVSFHNTEDGYITDNFETFGNIKSFINDGNMYAVSIAHYAAQHTDLTIENNGNIYFLGDFISYPNNHDYPGDDIYYITLENHGTTSGFVNLLNSKIINEEDGYISMLDMTSLSNKLTFIGDNYLINKGKIGCINDSVHSEEGFSGYLLFQQDDIYATTTFINEKTGTVFAALEFANYVEKIENYGVFDNNKYYIAKEANISIDNYGLITGVRSGSLTSDAWTINNHTTGIMEGAYYSPWLSINNEGTIQNMTFNSYGVNYYLQDSVTEKSIINNTGLITGTNSFLIQESTSVEFYNNGIMQGDNTFDYVDILNEGYITFNNGENGVVSGTLNFGVQPTGAINSKGILNDLTIISSADKNKQPIKLENEGLMQGDITLKDLEMDIINDGKIGYIQNATLVADNSKVNIENSGLIQNVALTAQNSGTFTLTNNEDGIIRNSFMTDASLTQLDNAGSINTDAINTSNLTLTNSGTINTMLTATNALNITNTGTITADTNAITLTNATAGVINNKGTISSNGTTITLDENSKTCTDCAFEDFTINNTGNILAIDTKNAPNPDLESYAINASNATVNNINGGVISGSVKAKTYTQDENSTFITYMDTQNSKTMNTISVADTISIDNGSTLSIVTNNDVTSFKDGDSYLFVNGAETQTDTQDNLNNFTITTDTPFANYEMSLIGNDGYIVFNSVDPLEFDTSTDIAASNHGKIVTQSQRVYEMFTNRDTAQVINLSSGDNPFYDNSINFMPLGGYAKQDSKKGKSGYNNKYTGGIGYIEHDFSTNIKGGFGLAYLYTKNTQKDDLKSKSTTNTYRPFAYINYEKGCFRADLAAGYAYHDVKDNRQYTSLGNTYTAYSKYNSDEYSANLNVGYKIYNENNITVEPIAGFYFAHVKTDAYKETGAGEMNMYVKADNVNSQKSMLGLKVKKEFILDNDTTITPEIHTRWYHEYGDKSGGVSAYFLAQEELFNNSGIESPEDLGDIAIRLTTASSGKFDFFCETYYQFGDSFYNVGAGLGLQYNF